MSQNKNCDDITKQPRVSVIIPVYKAGPYLRKCLDSILSQTLKDLEVICIDDGSPDDSGVICDEYAQKDGRIRVIHQKNSGTNPTSNLGIREAKGEYIHFLDADDWIDSTMYMDYYTKAKETGADVITANGFFNFYEVSGKITFTRKFPEQKENKLYTNITDIPELIQGHVCHWNAFFKNSFLLENKINFIPDRYSLGDMSFMYQVYGTAKSVFVMGKAYYHWLRRSSEQHVRYGYDKPYLQIWLNGFNYAHEKLEKSSKITLDKWRIMALREYKWFRFFYPQMDPKERLKVLLGYSELFRSNLSKGYIGKSDFSEDEWKIYNKIAFYGEEIKSN